MKTAIILLMSAIVYGTTGLMLFFITKTGEIEWFVVEDARYESEEREDFLKYEY